MDQALFDELKSVTTADGAQAAIDRLCEHLRQGKEYGALFYALLMKKRLELGLSPVATGSNQDVPAELQSAFEDGIREAGRTVGQLYLAEGSIPQAWAYFRDRKSVV